MDPSARFPPGDTVDVRPRHEYRVGHFASSVCCPLDELHDHLHRLPDHGEKFRGFGEEDEVARAIEYLEGRGYERVSPHPAAGAFASPTETVSSPWVEGEERVRLWNPSPFLDEILQRHLPDHEGDALDVACGSGRDSCWLALAGYRVTGVDILADALDKARDLALTCTRVAMGPPPLTAPRWITANLEEGRPFREACFDLVICFRFLHRPLLSALARMLRPGGALIYETFTEAQAAFGKPRRPEYLLAPGELRRRFEELGLQISLYRETSPPGGPALASLYALRPADAGPSSQVG
jgi:SAM-dependent methyltransferase